MKREITLYLEDILDAISLIENYTQNISKSLFDNNTQLQDAVIRRLEIIGEATKHLPSAFREKYPQVPWNEIAGMRDVLTHAYLNVKIDRVWTVIKYDLHSLKREIAKISAQEK